VGGVTNNMEQICKNRKHKTHKKCFQKENTLKVEKVYDGFLILTAASMKFRVF
jgi:hypothetical protein